jgi:ribosomal protein S7
MKRESNKETLSTSLGQEFFDCINRQGVSIKKRDQMYRLAANSRVYMRYKWW